MKRFITNFTFVFFLAFIILYAESRVQQYRINDAVQEINTLPSGKKIIALGDSHIVYSINDKACEEFVNRGGDSEPYYYNYLKLKALLENKQNNKDSILCIVVVMNPFSFASSRDSMFVKDKASHYYHVYMPFHQIYENSPMEHHLVIGREENFKSYIVSKLNFLNKERCKTFLDVDYKSYLSYYKGQYAEYDNKFDNNVELRVQSLIKTEKEFKWRFEESRQPLILEDIARLTMKYDIPLVLLNTPCNYRFHERVYKQLECFNDSISQSLAQRYNVRYIDLLRYPLPDSCFRDVNHLNTKGANIFTPMLRDTLISLGLY